MIKLFTLVLVLGLSSCQFGDAYKRDLACQQMKCPRGMVGVSYDVDGCGCQIKVD